MQFTQAEVRMLESADAKHGFVEIPDGCPVEIRQHILETRAKRMGIVPETENETKATLDALMSL